MKIRFGARCVQGDEYCHFIGEAELPDFMPFQHINEFVETRSMIEIKLSSTKWDYKNFTFGYHILPCQTH